MIERVGSVFDDNYSGAFGLSAKGGGRGGEGGGLADGGVAMFFPLPAD